MPVAFQPETNLPIVLVTKTCPDKGCIKCFKKVGPGRRNKECYELYFTRFIPHLEKKAIWNQKLNKANEDRDLITNSSEAVRLFLRENQWKCWLEMFRWSAGKLGSVKIDESLLKYPKFTRSAFPNKEGKDDDSKSQIGVNRGWSAEGSRGLITSIRWLLGTDRSTGISFRTGWMG